MRAKKKLTYVIEKIPPPQKIFKEIQNQTRMNEAQMYEDFNMGVGLVIFAPSSEVDKIFATAKLMEIKAWDSGFIKTGSRKVIIKPLGIEFSGESLQIR